MNASPEQDPYLRAALAKWPNVPACRGWLALDGRGQWWMRDEQAQKQGAKGSMIRHPALLRFIQTSYFVDEHGSWYFQNGPQRVYVELELAPFVFRLDLPAATGQDAAPTCHTHTGHACSPLRALTDEYGTLYMLAQPILAQRLPEPAPASLPTPLLGSIHPQDMVIASMLMEDDILCWGKQTLPLEHCRRQALETDFSFCRSPALTPQASHA